MSEASVPVLEAVSLSAGYGAKPVIRDIDVALHPGKIVALLGPNGAGKSTLLSVLAGALRPSAGELRWDGAPTRAPLHRRARAGVGFLSEDRSVFHQLSVADNLKLGRGSVDEAVDLFPELRPLLRRRTGLCSGGEQQMLGLARILAGRPRVLLADELSLGLAPIVVDRLLASIQQAAAEGLAVLLVEQQLSRALRVADEAIVLRNGQIALSGTSDDVRARSAEVEATYLSIDLDDAAPGHNVDAPVSTAH